MRGATSVTFFGVKKGLLARRYIDNARTIQCCSCYFCMSESKRFFFHAE